MVFLGDWLGVVFLVVIVFFILVYKVGWLVLLIFIGFGIEGYRIG